jgi:hypothetical protein
VVVFEKAARLLNGEPFDRKRPVNPYAVSLDPDRWEADGLYDDEAGITWRDARKLCKGLQFAWLDEFSGVT